MNIKHWTTKGGKKIPIKELTDGHLLNIIKWVDRNAEEIVAQQAAMAMSSYRGDIAEFPFDYGPDVPDCETLFPEIIEEAKERRLKLY